MTPAALRRLTHAGTACILIPSVFLAWPTFRILVTAAAAGWVTLEVVRIRMPTVHAWFARAAPVYRAHETGRVSGAGWLMIGYALAVWSTPTAATAGVLVAAFADPAASWLGTRFGDGSSKTTVGSTAFFLVALTVLVGVGVSWPTFVVVAIVATILERWTLGLNDNFVLAPAVTWLTWGLA